jgi:hypothetical protein
MRDAILASSYKWRRVSKLARLAGVSEGLPIATLKSKIRREDSV